jgi:orotidine-5'-phosphate decarboxylase
MGFAQKLCTAIQKKQSAVCVGLDPQWAKLPLFLTQKFKKEYPSGREAAARAYLEFNKGIIDATSDLVVAVKPQMAYYEELGSLGWWAFEETCAYAAQKGLLVIADGKRNDIGSTAETYARAFFGGEMAGEQFETSVDALTVNGYLGLDGIQPFLKACGEKDKGLFVLVKTSNPSSGDLQDRVTVDEKISIAELMGHFVESWGSDLVDESGYSSVGAVVGATFPQEAKKLRAIMPNSFFLVPGYGAQGGAAEDVKPCFNSDGLGALVVNARGILYAFAEGQPSLGENYAEAARQVTSQMKEALNQVR